MSNKVKFLVFSILDYLFSVGGCAAIIALNFVGEDNSTGYKLTLGGIVLVTALLFTAKAIFEHRFRQVYDSLLQQLAEASEQAVKNAISAKINSHKIWNAIYNRASTILPFAIVYIITWLGEKSLASLQSSIGLICTALVVGSVFNIIKLPYGDKARLESIKRKVM